MFRIFEEKCRFLFITSDSYVLLQQHGLYWGLNAKLATFQQVVFREFWPQQDLQRQTNINIKLMKTVGIFEMLILQPMNLNKIINQNVTTLWIYACFSSSIFCCLSIVIFLKKKTFLPLTFLPSATTQCDHPHWLMQPSSHTTHITTRTYPLHHRTNYSLNSQCRA
jgi:hypothetical protein